MKPKRSVPIPTRHLAHPCLTNKRIRVALVGCGGTGTQVLTALGAINATLGALPEPRSLDVVVYDPDRVTRANVGRQLFALGDIGQYKASVLVHRTNMFFGTSWQDAPTAYPTRIQSLPDILISCVDTAKARRDIHECLFFKNQAPRYWIDCGNLEKSGHVIVGQPPTMGYEGTFPLTTISLDTIRWQGSAPQLVRTRDSMKTRLLLRLPCVTEIYPELLDPDFVEDTTPSCSVLQAIERQSLFVNRMAATYAGDLFWQLLREGGLSHQGVLFDLTSGQTRPIPLRMWPLRPVKYQHGDRKQPVYPKGSLSF